MEIELESVVIGSGLSLFATILWDSYKFRRDNKYSYKLKLRNTIQLIKESILQVEQDIIGINEFIKKTNDTPEILPDLPQYPYTAIEQLAERVVNDDYYTANSRLLKNVIDSEKNYFFLKSTSIYIYKQLTQISRVVEEKRNEDEKRRRKYVDEVTKLRDICVETMKRDDIPQNIKSYIFATMSIYIDKRNDSFDIRTMQKLLVQPLVDYSFIELHKHNSSNELMLQIANTHLSYNEVILMNKHLAEVISGLVPPLISELKHLQEAYLFLNNSQVQSKFMS